MADVNVKHKTSNQGTSTGEGQRSGTQELQRQQGGGGGVSRSSDWDPLGFAVNPNEFFSNPFAVMRRMSEEMDRAFAQFYGQGQQGGGRSGWLPALDVSEREGQLHVHAELPGLKPEDVKVELTDDALVIRGERKYEHEHHVGKAYRSERRYGEFYREIPLPEGVNAEQARAQFRNGVLEVSIPVPQQASKRREIPISTGESGTTSAGTSRGQSTGAATSAAAAGAGGGTPGTGGQQNR